MQITIMAIPLYIANRTLTFRDFSKKSRKEKESEEYSNIKLPSATVYQEAKQLLEM
jgi:hypothetical protein